jgi:hypothetical protein
MVVSEHLPQAVKRFGRNPEAELRNVPFKKSANELLAPTAGNLVARSQQTVGKAASHPKLGNALRSYFRKTERCEFNVSDATGEGFARLAK